MAKGIFTPKNPQKYIGNASNIRFLSSWELRFQTFLDLNPNVIAWNSEDIKIPYYHPFKKRIANYLPDFLIKYKDANGNIVMELIEIKPKKEVAATKKSSVRDLAAITLNNAKWEAAQAYCKKANITFKILTEDNLFRK